MEKEREKGEKGKKGKKDAPAKKRERKSQRKKEESEAGTKLRAVQGLHAFGESLAVQCPVVGLRARFQVQLIAVGLCIPREENKIK